MAVSSPADIAADSQGNVFVASNGAHQPTPSFGSSYRSIEMIAPDCRSRTTIAGVTLDGVQQLAAGGQAPAVTGLAWARGALYGIVQNALVEIIPVN